MEQTTRTDISQVEIDTREEQLTAIPAAGCDLFLVSAAHAVIHAITGLMALIYPIIQVEYHLSYTQIGLIVAIPNAVGGFLQIAFGLLGRNVLRKIMLGVGNILVGICTFFTGTITGFWSLMVRNNVHTSTDMATAPPPPRQSVARPRPPPRRRSSCIKVISTREPLEPMG